MGITPAQYEAIQRLPSWRARYDAMVELLRAQGVNARVDPILLRAADAYDAAQARGGPSSEQLAVIVEAASHRLASIWYDGIGILGRASEQWPEAAGAIGAMSRDRKAHVRFCALCSLRPGTPADVTDQMIKSGLVDRSASVRWKAADRAASLGRSHLAAEVEAALAVERNQKARRSMGFDLERLRNPGGPAAR